jgi:type IV secretion system protein VirB10
MKGHPQAAESFVLKVLLPGKSGIKTVRNFLPGLLLLSFIPGAAQYDDAQVHIVPVASLAAPATQATQPGASRQDTKSQDVKSEDQQPESPQEVTIPAGTRLPLALVRSLSFKHTKPGDNVNLQFIFPVTAGDRMVIPPGTYLQGIIEQVTDRDRTYEVMSMRLFSADVIFATGYTASIYGPLDVSPTYGKLARRLPFRPATPGQVPVMASTGGPTLPPLPPLPHVGPSMGEMIGISVGLVAAAATFGYVVYHNHDLLMEAGTPVEITLVTPLVLDANRVTDAVQLFAKAPPEIVPPPRRMRTCWTPEQPGFPSTPYPCPY